LRSFRNLITASLSLILGFFFALIFLEVAFRLNPTLLLRGMNAPSPIDPPLETNKYDVYTSDADLFYWQSGIMRPVPPPDDQLEARVTYRTDELGFPNPAPVPENVDIIVLGRSFSMGAQSSDPWPQQLNEKGGYNVLNLSQTGSGIATKTRYLQKFGLIRNPQWIIVEVLPSMDIIGYQPDTKTLIQSVPFAVIHTLTHNQSPSNAPGDSYIYPVRLDIPPRSVELTFFSYYLSALTVNQTDLESSKQWQDFNQQLLKLVEIARSNKVCVILLYAPTKPDIYLPLVQDLSQLKPVRSEITPWKLTANHNLEQDRSLSSDFLSMQNNASAGRRLLSIFAAQHQIVFVDPSISMTQAILDGKAPFMRYDSHWSALGHQLVSDLVLEILKSFSCPP
jgi:hypothetical protein